MHIGVELGQLGRRLGHCGRIFVLGADDGAQDHGANAVVHHVHERHVAHRGQLLSAHIRQLVVQLVLAVQRHEERGANAYDHDGDEQLDLLGDGKVGKYGHEAAARRARSVVGHSGACKAAAPASRRSGVPLPETYLSAGRVCGLDRRRGQSRPCRVAISVCWIGGNGVGL